MKKILLPRLVVALALSLLAACAPISIGLDGLTKGYSLSGAANSNVPFGLDDEMDIYLNGRLLQSVLHSNQQSQPIYFNAKAGDVLQVQVKNTFLLSECLLNPLYLRDDRGNTMLLTDGFYAILCANDIVFDSGGVVISF